MILLVNGKTFREVFDFDLSMTFLMNVHDIFFKRKRKKEKKKVLLPPLLCFLCCKVKPLYVKETI